MLLYRKIPFLFLLVPLLLSSCTRLVGYGVLLWSMESPPVPSGTVLPVHIRSNINQVWVTGIPAQYRSGDIDKMEIPLPKLELYKSRGAAKRRAAEFAKYARTYAENMQDGLPIREEADNGARRVYRLRMGEVVKVLGPAKGSAAIGGDGSPLPGDWYKVMAENGSTGYCFSYRLNIFEQTGSVLAAREIQENHADDTELETLLAKTWSPEIYDTMLNEGRLDLDALSKHWAFEAAEDTGIARIKMPNLDMGFTYTGIKSTGNRSWRFEGTNLQMTLRSEQSLAVQYTEQGGAMRSLLFVNLPVDVDDLIVQETSRREQLFNRIYTEGPNFTSNNYGTISFTGGGKFNWTGNELLIPRTIPANALSSGTISMDLFLHKNLGERFDGAFTLNFDSINSNPVAVHFLYTLDNQGFRLELAPESSLEGRLITRRAASPMVIYFFTGL